MMCPYTAGPRTPSGLTPRGCVLSANVGPTPRSMVRTLRPYASDMIQSEQPHVASRSSVSASERARVSMASTSGLGGFTVTHP
eukprot:2408628-Prymnesium_polylepis.2